MTTTNPVHSLTFGNLTWIEEGANPPDSSGVQYVVAPEDATLGTPIPLTTALLSLMRAGSLVAYDSTPNREPVFRVRVIADDSDLLARGEKALQAECEKTNTLTWTPPDGAGEPTVLDIVWSHLELQFDPSLEAVTGRREYLVRLQALPYARPATTVVTPAQTTATETSIDNGSSATGWSALFGAVVSVVSGAINVTLNPTDELRIDRTGTVSFTGTPYVAITYQSTLPPTRVELVFYQGTTAYGSLPVVTTVSGGWTVAYYAVPTGWTSATSLRIWPRYVANGNQTFKIDQVSTWTGVPFFGTARQKAMSLIPGGSSRTQGSLHVTSAGGSSLGRTIVFTHKSGTGYVPPLRQWLLSSGTVTTDSTLVSGARNPIGATTTIYQIPATALPTGRAEIWAKMRSTSPTGSLPIDWALASYMGSSLIDYDLRLTNVTFAAINTWYLVPLGVASMPPVKIGPAGFVQVHLHYGASTVEVDEAYLFATDSGRLTIVDCSTGTAASGGPSRHLWVDAPSPAQPQGGIYRGHAADRSDAFHAGSSAVVWQTHDFESTGTNVFVASENATDATTDLEHYRRYPNFVFREF